MIFLLFMGGLQAAVEKKGFWGEWTEKVKNEVESIEAITMPQRFGIYNFNDQEVKNFKHNLKQMKFTPLNENTLQVKNQPITNLFRYDEDCLQKAHEAAEKYKLMREWQERNPYYLASIYNSYQKINPYNITTVTFALTLGYLLMPRYTRVTYCPGER